MSNEINPFEAAIAALEARRAQINAEIDTDIDRLKEIAQRSAGAIPLAGVERQPNKIEKDTFFNLGIAEAALKYLKMVDRKPRSTNNIIDMLEKGGLKRSTYGTVYAILKRRENHVGDVVNVNGDWGLPEWYGSKPKPKKRVGSEKNGANENGQPSTTLDEPQSENKSEEEVPS